MTKFTATIIGNDIHSSRIITIEGTLAQAKRAAHEEFGGGFRQHKIVVSECLENGDSFVVATRGVTGRKWMDGQYNC